MEEETQKVEAPEVEPDKPADDTTQEGSPPDNTQENEKPVIDAEKDNVNTEITDEAKSSDPEQADTADKSEDAVKEEPLTKDASNGDTADDNKDIEEISKDDAKQEDAKDEVKEEAKKEAKEEDAEEAKEEAKENEPESAQTSAREPTPACTRKNPQDESSDTIEEPNVQEDSNPETKVEASPEMKEAQGESFSESYKSHGQSPDMQKVGHSQLSHATQDSELLSPPPHNISVINRTAHPTRNGINTSLSLNKMAIAASAQNKLPVSRLKGIMERVGRHTESSAKKRGNWYKSETSYVDVNSYSWKNLSLYKDYQQHMWKGDGTVKSSCKK